MDDREVKKIAKAVVRKIADDKIPKIYKNPKKSKLFTDALVMITFGTIFISMTILIADEILDYNTESEQVKELKIDLKEASEYAERGWDWAIESSEKHKKTLQLLDCSSLKQLLIDDDYSGFATTIRDLILVKEC